MCSNEKIKLLILRKRQESDTYEDFLEVQRIFNHNFLKYGEVGSSLCVIVDGEIVIDIWAGHKNKKLKLKSGVKILSFQLLFLVLKLRLLCVHIY